MITQLIKNAQKHKENVSCLQKRVLSCACVGTDLFLPTWKFSCEGLYLEKFSRGGVQNVSAEEFGGVHEHVL